ncbi:glyceraldehyde 3-phosphate dehydrogenase NAD-binding domain-containing protein [Scopulibacillus darangshiensis]|uniref:glyceraldehyde 3-phosphate dehydrogenase NAD-binding domain-containing protein n=1 Tax=Scopulibacillus darangshiensis TaxID=442528 RepID=UPI001FB53119|nr:glyceraldehyde 3-phosphate dehydrogenase NAD-binding domain-containing protein [Scopulibacillus darangshiensis]
MKEDNTLIRGIGISGTGRIGRLLIRKMLSSTYNQWKLVGINSIYPVETVAHLLKYDTVHGIWDANISIQDGNLLINGYLIQFVSERNPENIPWGRMNVDIVIDATGEFRDRQGTQKHIAAGASNEGMGKHASML